MNRAILLTSLSLAMLMGLSALLSPLKAAPRELDPALAPVQYIYLAQEAFQGGKKEDATFLLYVGQLRYRAYLIANPQLDPSGEPALFASLMEVVALPINKHAFGNVDEALGLIDEALAWDAANPDTSIPKKARERSRAGLKSLRKNMSENSASIRAQREANGLENR